MQGDNVMCPRCCGDVTRESRPVIICYLHHVYVSWLSMRTGT